MYAINRSKNFNSKNSKQESRRFVRQNSPSPIQQFYTEGVQSIIDHRRLLEVKTDTILLSIDLFRNYLNKGGPVAKATVIPLCIACILVAAKVNEVFPPRIDDVAEVFDYFQSREELIKMQAWILKHCQYNIPFSQNLVNLLQQKLGEQKQKNIEQAIKTLFKCLSQPYFLKIQNEIIAKAIVFQNLEFYEVKKPTSKQIATVIHIMKQKSQRLQSSFLKSRDLNIISQNY